MMYANLQNQEKMFRGNVLPESAPAETVVSAPVRVQAVSRRARREGGV